MLDVKLGLDALMVKVQIILVYKLIVGFASFTHVISCYWTN